MISRPFVFSPAQPIIHLHLGGFGMYEHVAGIYVQNRQTVESKTIQSLNHSSPKN